MTVQKWPRGGNRYLVDCLNGRSNVDRATIHRIVPETARRRTGMGMTRATFSAWLEQYGRAWEARDARAAAELYAEDGTYQVTPFVEPMRGRAAILDYWTHVAQTEEQVQFSYEILAVTSKQGIARWRASFVIAPPGLQTKLDGIFLIALDGKGKCTWLREWWHKQQTE